MLPIEPVLPALWSALEARGLAVLQAPPGAGLASISRKSWAGISPREVSWWAVAKPAWPAQMMMLR